ncbi:MAG: hypothetical protein JWR38_5011 [Mucilaginibacter sp.]|nr:hypothetical protein [Mucilaginibacter sp.]
MRYLLFFLFLISNVDILFAQAVYPFADINNNWGVVNDKKEIVLPPSYEKMDFFHDHESKDATAIVKKGKTGLINSTGTLIIPCIYDSIKYFGAPFVKVSLHHKEGIANQKTGAILVKPLYDSISYSYTQKEEQIYFVVYKNKVQEYIDENGKKREKPTYHYEGAVEMNRPRPLDTTVINYTYALLKKHGDTSHYNLKRYDDNKLVYSDTVRLYGCKIDSLLFPNKYDDLLIQIKSLSTGKKGLASYSAINSKLQRGLRLETPFWYDDIKPLYKTNKKGRLLCWILIKDDLLGVALAGGEQKIMAKYASIIDSGVEKMDEDYVLIKTLNGSTCYGNIRSGEVYINE